MLELDSIERHGVRSVVGRTQVTRVEAHLEGALALPRSRWEAQPYKREADRAPLRAAALHRSEAALDWLLGVVSTGDRASAETVITELGAYRGNPRLRAILSDRADPGLQARYRQTCPAPDPSHS